MGAVFGRAMDGESENGRFTRSVKFALIGEAPFLLVTFLWALAKKSDPPTAEALAPQANLHADAQSKNLDSYPNRTTHPRPTNPAIPHRILRQVLLMLVLG